MHFPLNIRFPGLHGQIALVDNLFQFLAGPVDPVSIVLREQHALVATGTREPHTTRPDLCMRSVRCRGRRVQQGDAQEHHCRYVQLLLAGRQDGEPTSRLTGSLWHPTAPSAPRTAAYICATAHCTCKARAPAQLACKRRRRGFVIVTF